MIDPDSIRKDMAVIASDGERIGEVDATESGAGAAEDARIKLRRSGSLDGQHHYVSMSDVARVDEHVHLSRSAADVRSLWVTGAAVAGGAVAGAGAGAAVTGEAVAEHGAREVHVEGGSNWLPWILGALALLALLVFGLRSCTGNERAAVAPAEKVAAEPAKSDVAVPVAVAVAEEVVPLPGGGSVALTPRTIGYDLQRYLASDERAPRSFRFERLNFDTAKADVRALDRPTVDGLGQILVAYPAVRVRLIGYADARGDAAANVDLGDNRAKAVAAALIAKGVAADRIETATGGETAATDTNATATGQAENRRTELVVLTK